MKTKSNIDVILVFTSLISYFKQCGHDFKFIHFGHEKALISATSYFNSRVQHNINMNKSSKDMFRLSIRDFRSVLAILKFKLPTKLHGQLFTALLKYQNILPNSVHPALTPAMVFKGQKFNIKTQRPILFGTYASIHYAKRVSKYHHTKNGIILYLADSNTHKMFAWIPGRNDQ